MEDTIAAIATSLGVGAISIIRVSGKEAIKIVNKIFNGKNLNVQKTHTIHYGYICDKYKKIDEVLVSVMLSPKTFTTEDIVEINCHGGIVVTKKILELLLLNGCRLAEPGEFTKRAFLNGRIDLLEAEAVMDVINSKNEKARNLAINQLTGTTSDLIHDMRKQVLNIIAQIEVNIDYPEYEDIEQLSNKQVHLKLEQIINKIKDIINKSEDSKIIKEGINACIIGKPNVGKSSILNKLIGEEKAIVTDIEGTTRDVVEGTINLDGLTINFIDTAGIRTTTDLVETIGVKKSLALINKADLILFVLNNNEKMNNEEKSILDKIKSKKHIIIINKSDLQRKLEQINDKNLISINTKDPEKIEILKNKIKSLYGLGELESKDLTYLSDARSIALLKKALESLNSALINSKTSIPIDMVEIDLKEAWNFLGEIIGETYQDELLNELFSQFCLGK